MSKTDNTFINNSKDPISGKVVKEDAPDSSGSNRLKDKNIGSKNDLNNPTPTSSKIDSQDAKNRSRPDDKQRDPKDQTSTSGRKDNQGAPNSSDVETDTRAKLSVTLSGSNQQHLPAQQFPSSSETISSRGTPVKLSRVQEKSRPQKKEEGFIQQLLTAKRRSMRLMQRGQKAREELLGRARLVAKAAIEEFRQKQRHQLTEQIDHLTAEEAREEIEATKKMERTLAKMKEAFETHQDQIVESIEKMVLDVHPKFHKSCRLDMVNVPTPREISDSEFEANAAVYQLDRSNSEGNSSTRSN